MLEFNFQLSFFYEICTQPTDSAVKGQYFEETAVENLKIFMNISFFFSSFGDQVSLSVEGGSNTRTS